MSDTINTEQASGGAVSSATNTTTKAALLQRAKEAVEAGEQNLHDAAEALGLADDDHSATQREMAKAIGKSVGWVNRLLKWRRSGYTEHSPFGPTTKKARVQHAKQRARASEAPKTREPKPAAASADDDDAAASAERRKAKYAKEEADTAPPTVTSPLGGFKAAVDHWFPKMDYNEKREAINYVIAQGGIQVSCAT